MQIRNILNINQFKAIWAIIFLKNFWYLEDENLDCQNLGVG